MFASISFTIGSGKIEVSGHSFDLGELTTEILNLPKEIYAEMRHTLETAEHHFSAYERSHELSNWFSGNEEMIRLDQQMMQYHIFRLVKQESSILSESRLYTQQLSLFPEEDHEPTESDMDVLEQIVEYSDYLDDPDARGKEDIPAEPPPLTRALMIIPGNAELKWLYYRQFIKQYSLALRDVESFNSTIMNFIYYYLSDVENMNHNSYVAALQEFLENPRREKLIANPLTGTGFYINADPVVLRHIPRETKEGSGEYRIYECYEAKLLQTMLKMDFYRALEAGHVIRRCEFCGRYFLLKRGYHTKYCDQPNPENPRYTCAQLGYHFKGIKEAAGDNPKAQSLRRCKMRIDKDYNRGIIDDEQRSLLTSKALDLYHTSYTNPEISNDDFEKQLMSEKLYALCGVDRYTNKRGRPKGNKSKR